MSDLTCHAEDCDNTHYGNGFCQPHYKQMRKMGYVVPLRKRHGLSEIDRTESTATCAVCGPNAAIYIRPNGLKMHCKARRRQNTRNPLPPYGSVRSGYWAVEPSKWHRLTEVDNEASVADCSICGPRVPVKMRRNRSPECCGKVQWESTQDRAALARMRRAYKLRTQYGLTPEQYEAMVAEQNGECAICGCVPERLLVDHNHETGETRGLLCNPCNTGIGFLGDSPTRLVSAALYLGAKTSAAA